MTTTALAVGAFAALSLALAAPSSAAPKVPSKLAFEGYDAGTFTFSGSVSSGSKKCERGRTVVFSDGGQKLASKKTGKGGAFTVDVGELGDPSVLDGFEGEVKKRKVGTRKKRKLCKADLAAVRVEAHATSFSNFNFDSTTEVFTGSVSSSLPECASALFVELHVDDGSGPTLVQGSSTDTDGAFELSVSGKAGTWDVRAPMGAEILVARSNGDLIFASCSPPDPTDSEDITLAGDAPSLSITYDGQLFAFFGTLSSSVPACLAGRVVELWDGNTLVGSSPVNEGNGSWTVAADAASGHTYTAEINEFEVLGESSPFTLCEEVVSNGFVPSRR